ncbi:MAG: hypothetical protein AAB663_01655 [Patescibacteria group bacterium]
MLTILFMVACVSDVEQAERDALWTKFETECLANGRMEDALKKLPTCYSREPGRCGHEAAETAIAESNARIDSLVEQRRQMESSLWIARYTWRCIDGRAYGKHLD